MTRTPGISRMLDYVSQELVVVQSICQSATCSVVIPNKYKADVMSHLPNSKIFHFAGHGTTHPTDPSKSSLLLEDCGEDPLTVANLLELNLRERSPFLAYLSACGIGDQRFFDESIHLISGCQLAGFRHTIGTLWEVNDGSCLDMARITYEEMMQQGMTDESVCLEGRLSRASSANVRCMDFGSFSLL
jgi:CHAT domain-containing protein